MTFLIRYQYQGWPCQSKPVASIARAREIVDILLRAGAEFAQIMELA